MTKCPLFWHEAPRVRALLDELSASDLRLVLVRGLPAPDRLDWAPASEHGARIFEALTALRQQSVGPAFSLATTDCARAAALAVARRMVTVEGALAARFGDPDRWLGFGPLEATRRFRANWGDWIRERAKQPRLAG